MKTVIISLENVKCDVKSIEGALYENVNMIATSIVNGTEHIMDDDQISFEKDGDMYSLPKTSILYVKQSGHTFKDFKIEH